MDETQLVEIVKTVRPYTMVSDVALQYTASLTAKTVMQDVEGVLVECGTWRDGSSMAMMLAQRRLFGRVVRPVYLLDSFEGLPADTERDGPLATAYQRQEVLTEWYYNNCRASVRDVEAGMAELEFEEGDFSIVPGWFEQTLPGVVQQLAGMHIALLRIDCDWYDSVSLCWEQLEPLVSPEGIIILDDYYAFNGCARAAHEYLARRDLPYRIQSIPDFQGVYLVKRAARAADR